MSSDTIMANTLKLNLIRNQLSPGQIGSLTADAKQKIIQEILPKIMIEQARLDLSKYRDTTRENGDNNTRILKKDGNEVLIYTEDDNGVVTDVEDNFWIDFFRRLVTRSPEDKNFKMSLMSHSAYEAKMFSCLGHNRSNSGDEYVQTLAPSGELAQRPDKTLRLLDSLKKQKELVKPRGLRIVNRNNPDILGKDYYPDRRTDRQKQDLLNQVWAVFLQDKQYTELLFSPVYDKFFNAKVSNGGSMRPDYWDNVEHWNEYLTDVAQAVQRDNLGTFGPEWPKRQEPAGDDITTHALIPLSPGSQPDVLMIPCNDETHLNHLYLYVIDKTTKQIIRLTTTNGPFRGRGQAYVETDGRAKLNLVKEELYNIFRSLDHPDNEDSQDNEEVPDSEVKANAWRDYLSDYNILIPNIGNWQEAEDSCVPWICFLATVYYYNLGDIQSALTVREMQEKLDNLKVNITNVTVSKFFKQLINK